MQPDEIKRFVAQRLADVAAFNGCFGKEDGICIELRPDDPVEWCKYCVQGAAAKLLVAQFAEPPRHGRTGSRQSECNVTW